MTTRHARRRASLAAAAGLLAIAGCGPRALTLPSGDGEPFPDYQAAYEQASAGCRQARTLTAEISVSGRVGPQKLRGRILAGFERPASLRLEGVAPFGPPAFILTASSAGATLLLPRDPAVLTGEPAEAILGALVGLELTPVQLQSILAGCGAPWAEPAGGRSFTGGWARVDLGAGAAAYLKSEAGRWRILAAMTPPLRVEYGGWQGGRPGAIHLLLEEGRAPADLHLRVSQVEVNVALDPTAFNVRVPPGAVRITLEELRQAGPLGHR